MRNEKACTENYPRHQDCFRKKVVASFIKKKTMLYSFFDKGLTKYIEIKKKRAIKIADIIIKVTKVDINIAYLSFYCAYNK